MPNSAEQPNPPKNEPDRELAPKEIPEEFISAAKNVFGDSIVKIPSSIEREYGRVA